MYDEEKIPKRIINGLLHNKKTGIIIVDAKDVVIFDNDTVIKLLGKSYINKKFPFNAEFKENIKSTDSFEYNLIVDSRVKNLQITSIKIDGAERIWAFSDISVQVSLREDLLVQKHNAEYNANYDYLSELPNRRKFNEDIKNCIDNNTIFSLLYIDIDHFKDYNEIYGHGIGDKIIKAFAKRLKDIAPNALNARLSGDEFVILCRNSTREYTSNLAKKIVSSNVESLEKYDSDLKNIFITTSVGISGFPSNGNDPEKIISNADYALLNVKSNGGNSYVFYTEQMRLDRLHRITIQNDIKDGIDRDEFILYYQPQIDSRTEELVGMEALVRWNHPTKGLVFPNEFIPYAEESGLIIELDRYLLKKIMKDAEFLKTMHNFRYQISVNLNVQQLQHDFVGFIEKVLVNCTFSNPKCTCDFKNRVKFEITETAIMTKPERSIKALIELSKMGIELLIDDFGTGYSSLAYLVQLPISTLKIDKTFTDTILNGDPVVLKSIIEIAKNMNLKTIVEGVETKEQVEYLKKLNTFIIQGYYYSKPILIEDIIKKYFKC